MDLVEPGGVDARQLDEHRIGHRQTPEVREAAQHVDIVGVVGGTAVLGGIAQEAGVGELAHQLGGDPGRLDQLVVVVGGLLGSHEQPRQGAGIVALEQGADRGEREAA